MYGMPEDHTRAWKPQDWSYRWFWASMWALETEHEERAFNCWVISPAPRQRWRLGVMSYDCKPRRKNLKQRDFSWVWNKLALPTKALSHKNQKKKGGPSSHNCAGLPCALCNPLHTSYTHTHRHNNNNNNGKMSFKGEDSCLFILWSYGGDSLVISPMLMV